MPKQLAVVMIHGIGRQQQDYAARMIRNIEQQLVVQGYEPDAIAWQPVYWDDILAPAEKAYLERSLDTASLRAHRLRELVVTVLGDATGYRQLSAERVSADELKSLPRRSRTNSAEHCYALSRSVGQPPGADGCSGTFFWRPYPVKLCLGQSASASAGVVCF